MLPNLSTVARHRHHFYSHFPLEAVLASCPFDLFTPFVRNLCIFSGEAKTFRVFRDTIPPCLSSASGSVSLHHNTFLKLVGNVFV